MAELAAELRISAITRHKNLSHRDRRARGTERGSICNVHSNIALRETGEPCALGELQNAVQVSAVTAQVRMLLTVFSCWFEKFDV